MNKSILEEMKENLKWIPVSEIKDEILFPQHKVAAKGTQSSSTTSTPPQWTPTKQWKEFEGLSEIFTDDVMKSLSKHFS